MASSSSSNFFHHQSVQASEHQQQSIQQRLQPSQQSSKEQFYQPAVSQPIQQEVQQPPKDHHYSDPINNNNFHLENTTNQTYNQQLACSVPAVNLQLRNFKGEAYSDNEKLRVLSFTKILGFLGILLSLTLLIGSIVYYYKLPSDMFVVLSLDAIGILVISVLTVIWGKRYQAKILSTDKPEEGSKQFVSNRLTQVVFNTTCLLFIVNILLAIHYCNGLGELKDLSTALNGTQGSNIDFKDLGMTIVLFIGVAILILILAILGFFLFAEFIVGIGLRDLTLTAHIFNFLLICLAIFIVFASKKSIQSQLNQGIIIGNQEQQSQSSPSNQYSTLGYCCVALAAINSIALLRKNRQEYFWIGTIMLFACCVISAFTREAHQMVDVIENKNNNSWQEELSAMNQNKVLKELNCQKYVINNQQSTDKTVYSTDCDPEQQILVWEDIQKVPLNQRNYNLACLNENCQGQLKLQHSFWTRLLVFTMALTNESLFVVIIAFYQISLTMSKKKPIIETRDIVFVVSSLLLSASTLLLISRQDFSQKSISSTII